MQLGDSIFISFFVEDELGAVGILVSWREELSWQLLVEFEEIFAGSIVDDFLSL